MQSSYPAQFTREMGCTESEWRRWLPDAVGTHAWEASAGQINVDLPPGQLTVKWQVLEPRTIGLARFPRMQVVFKFDGLDGAQRYAFMKRFDLYTHRGGG
jgi:hypothetical protein